MLTVWIGSLCISPNLHAQQINPPSPTLGQGGTEVSNQQLFFFNPTIDFIRSSSKVPITVNYFYQNQGNKPALIQSAKCACGCMTSFYSKDSILPGEIGTVQVSFNASNRYGKINKYTTVRVEGGQIIQLKLRGETLPDSACNHQPLTALLSPQTIKVPDLRPHELRSFEIPYHNQSNISQFIQFNKGYNKNSDLSLGIYVLPENMPAFQPNSIRAGFRVLIPPGQKGHITLLLRSKAVLPSDFSYSLLLQSLLMDSEVEVEIEGNFITR